MSRKKKKLTGTIDDYPFVEVRWFDCIADNSWMPISKAIRLKPSICYSKGYQLLKTREKITIFADYSVDEDGTLEVGNLNTIPGAWVQEVTEIVIK
jgi:hypothetical protein